jgi:hypothetical protein
MITGRFDAPVPAQRMVTYYWLLRISPEVLKNAVPGWSRFRVRQVLCKARATGPTEVWCSSVGVLVGRVLVSPRQLRRRVTLPLWDAIMYHA